jgi:uncharacterized membrane protein (DUF373 family)
LDESVTTDLYLSDPSRETTMVAAGLRTGAAKLGGMKTMPDGPALRGAVRFLLWSERLIFFAIGVLLFAAAVALLKQSVQVLFSMFAGAGSPILFGSQFLDVILLVLMVVELAYTVLLSLRGSVLLPEPFLIVGLIAVIRRILVITVGEVGPSGSSISASAIELGILTGVVVVFVGSITLLRSRPHRELSAEDRLE